MAGRPVDVEIVTPSTSGLGPLAGTTVGVDDVERDEWRR